VRVVDDRGADVVSLGRGSAPEANLQAGKLAHRGHRLGQGEVEFARGGDVALQGGAMADHSTGIKMRDDLQAMPAQDISRGRQQVVGVDFRRELAQLAGLHGSGNLSRAIGGAKMERHGNEPLSRRSAGD
jgi:hypothetical protein